MNIELHEILIKDLVENYTNSDEEGVIGYNGKLNIRPPYQREFVYKPEQRDKVIDTVMKNFPLNVMYWVKSGDNSFELMDGQQRTISICEYFKCNFPVNFRYFFNLTDTEKEEFLNYCKKESLPQKTIKEFEEKFDEWVEYCEKLEIQSKFKLPVGAGLNNLL